MIRGAVNHDQKLKIGVGLRQHRLDRHNDGGGGVMTGMITLVRGVADIKTGTFENGADKNRATFRRCA